MRHNSILKNILLIVICAALAGGLVYMVRNYRAEESARSRELAMKSEEARAAELQQREEQLREKEKSISESAVSGEAEETASSADGDETSAASAISDTEDKSTSGDSAQKSGGTGQEADISAGDKADSSVSSTSSSSDADSSSSETDTGSSSEAEETEEQLPLVISCRGDAFQEMDDADKATGYPAKLEALLKEESVDGEVKDYTWDMAGSLSQIRLAGVSQSVVDAYIEDHVRTAQESGITPRNTETQIRIDFDRVDTSRDDEQAIPVICMGYYGGFGQSLDELAEQQQLILDTYELRENADGDKEFIIMGFYPSGWSDPAEYDKVMKEMWGDHYLSLNQELSVGAISDEGRQAIAEALLKKLKELNYIPSES